MFDAQVVVKFVFLFMLLMGFTGCSYLNELVSSEPELSPSEQEKVRKEKAERVFSKLLDADITNADDATYEEYIEVMDDIKAKDENVYDKCNQFLCQKSAEKYPKACEAYSSYLRVKQESATQIMALFDKDIQNAGEDIYRRYLELMDDVKTIDENKYNQYNKFLCQEAKRTWFKACGAYLSYLKANKEKNKEEYSKLEMKIDYDCSVGYAIPCEVVYEQIGVYKVKTQGSFVLYDSPFLKANLIAEPNDAINMEISDTINKVTIHLMKMGKINYQGMPCFESISRSLDVTDELGEYPDMSKRCFTYPSLNEVGFYNKSFDATRTAIKGTQKAIFIEVSPHILATQYGADQREGFTIVIKRDQAKEIMDNVGKFFKKYMEFKKHK